MTKEERETLRALAESPEQAKIRFNPQTVLALLDALDAVEGEDAARAHIAALEAENAKLREAVTPSEETKEAYSLKFMFSYSVNDWSITKEYLQWDAIKDIMAAIRARAALGEGK